MSVVKTTLPALAAAVIFCLAATGAADAVPNENAGLETADAPDRIPKERIIEREYAEWRHQYVSATDFNVKQSSIKAYTTSDLPQNGWNQRMQEIAILIHNFETINGDVGNGYELVALHAARERLLGAYAAPGPVSKLHDWAISEYGVAESLREIDGRISSIIPEERSHLVSEYVSAFNEMAEHGNVPAELHDRDSDYWIMVKNASLCGYVVDCDLEWMQNALDDGSYDARGAAASTLGISDAVLPKAYAVTYVDSIGTLYVISYTCEYDNSCIKSDHKPGKEPYEIHLYTAGPDEHSFGNTIKVSTSTCTSGNDITAHVTGDLEAKGKTFLLWAKDATCTVDSRTFDLGGNPSASWFFDVVTTHQAWVE